AVGEVDLALRVQPRAVAADRAAADLGVGAARQVEQTDRALDQGRDDDARATGAVRRIDVRGLRIVGNRVAAQVRGGAQLVSLPVQGGRQPQRGRNLAALE